MFRYWIRKLTTAALSILKALDMLMAIDSKPIDQTCKTSMRTLQARGYTRSPGSKNPLKPQRREYPIIGRYEKATPESRLRCSSFFR